MTVKTDPLHADALAGLLSEARAEADALRLKLQVYENTLLTSRLVLGHELKRPATALSGYLDLLLEEIDTENVKTVKETVKKAQSECQVLNDLNSFFLELVKFEKDSVNDEGQFLVVKDCIEEVIKHFPAELNAERRINLHVAADAKTVIFNSNAFKVILSNVVENALIYSDGEAPVNLTVEKTTDKRGMTENDLVRIKVADQGPGIPDDSIRRIFRPFVRLNGRGRHGAGLGLTLVRSLVELHGGSVYIRSVEGQGTTVQITVAEIPARNGGAFVS
jgi:signal transduction histidine kinase